MNTLWSSIGVIGGTGVLSYLAAGRTAKDGDAKGKLTFRLSIDGKGSLIGDVRLLGGVLTLGAAAMAKDGDTKKVLGVISLVSFASLFTTELIRMKLVKANDTSVAAKLPVFPSFAWANSASYGALPGPQGNASFNGAPSYQGAGWAGR